MSAENNGGPAFPQKLEYVGPTNDPIRGVDVPAGTIAKHSFPGMSLRDYFAGQALCGIAAHLMGPNKRAGESEAQASARWSYQVADAMIAERAK